MSWKASTMMIITFRKKNINFVSFIIAINIFPPMEPRLFMKMFL